MAQSFSSGVSRCEPTNYGVTKPKQRWQVAMFEGNYKEYEADLHKRKGSTRSAEADQVQGVGGGSLWRATELC
jgi:hypothetical protein